MDNLMIRRAEFVYNAARLAEIGSNAPEVLVIWDEREQSFKDQFIKVIKQQCGKRRSQSPKELHGSAVFVALCEIARQWIY